MPCHEEFYFSLCGAFLKRMLRLWEEVMPVDVIRKESLGSDLLAWLWLSITPV